jgi:hypothetical protein
MGLIIMVLKSLFNILGSNPFAAASFIVAIIVLLVFQWWRQRKVFKYKVISGYSLFDVDKQFSDRVKILFDDKPVDRVSLIVIELRNSGWVPIEDKDFFTPVEVSFGEKAEIMSIETDETRPKDMGIVTVDLGSKLRIEPTLFNRGDFVCLKVLVRGYTNRVTVSGRIKGVPKIKKEDLELKLILIFLMSASSGVMISVVYNILNILKAGPIIKSIFIIITLLVFALIGYFFYRKLRRNQAEVQRIRIYED